MQSLDFSPSTLTLIGVPLNAARELSCVAATMHSDKHIVPRMHNIFNDIAASHILMQHLTADMQIVAQGFRMQSSTQLLQPMYCSKTAGILLFLTSRNALCLPGLLRSHSAGRAGGLRRDSLSVLGPVKVSPLQSLLCRSASDPSTPDANVNDISVPRLNSDPQRPHDQHSTTSIWQGSDQHRLVHRCI